MTPENFITQLELEGDLAKWQTRARSEDREEVESDLYNSFLLRCEDYGLDDFADSIMEHGLQCLDWDAIMDLLSGSSD